MAIILGYAIPGVLMVLPSPYISTSAQQQVAIVIWVLFPLWVSSFQTGFYALWINNWFQNQTSQSAAELASLNLRLLRYTYGSIFVLCAFAHVATVSFSTVAWLLPMLFAPRYVAAFHPSQLLFPANPSSVGSIGEGVLNFLQWDQWLGYSAALIWAVTLYHDAQAKEKRVRSWDVLLAKIVGLIAVAGPGSAVIAVIWARDEIVLGEEVTRGEEIKPDEIS
ncbi:MAG: hypothetical protein M1827_007461 [Pycnora praestabilis]|nr:MAG: hypothetical protein M1827_007461 [Pycnora praestabilis]